jgi:putative tricarboxylic transport membrane protein
MLISGGSLDIFVTRPISGGIFLVMAPVVMASIVTARRRRRLAQRAGTVPIEDELATAAPDPDRRATPGDR